MKLRFAQPVTAISISQPARLYGPWGAVATIRRIKMASISTEKQKEHLRHPPGGPAGFGLFTSAATGGLFCPTPAHTPLLVFLGAWFFVKNAAFCVSVPQNGSMSSWGLPPPDRRRRDQTFPKKLRFPIWKKTRLFCPRLSSHHRNIHSAPFTLLPARPSGLGLAPPLPFEFRHRAAVDQQPPEPVFYSFFAPSRSVVAATVPVSPSPLPAFFSHRNPCDRSGPAAGETLRPAAWRPIPQFLGTPLKTRLAVDPLSLVVWKYAGFPLRLDLVVGLCRGSSDDLLRSEAPRWHGARAFLGFLADLSATKSR